MNEPVDFIRNTIRDDLAAGKNDGRVQTRFPPDPNGYLHIGHVEAICLNFGVADEFGGACNLRFDDTNPEKEEQEFIDAIEADIHWLGFEWSGQTRYASDYFDALYEGACRLIEQGKAYVDSQSAEEIRENRGTLTEPGIDSPFRNRTAEENLDLFERMRAGEFAEGTHVLRAKIDMASPNMNMRDPAIYRIKAASHPRTGNAWHIYPMYDYAHCLSDKYEAVTHSLCSLEFEDHRPLYEWFLEQLEETPHPQQIEFSRLEVEYAMTSKRRIARLIDEGVVSGFDDPRLMTLAGLRRRGIPPAALRDFVHRTGVTKSNKRVELALLEFCVRSELESAAPRAMVVMNPLKLVITNLEAGETIVNEAPFHPNDESLGSRPVTLARELWIEQEDFEPQAPRKYKRLTVGREVRLRYGCIVKCTDFVTDADDNVVEVHCTYDPDTRSGTPGSSRKTEGGGGVIHWVPAGLSPAVEVRVFEPLFLDPEPGEDYLERINPESRAVRMGYAEPALDAALGTHPRFQFERQGYFAEDTDSAPGARVFNRIVTLRDTWGKRNG